MAITYVNSLKQTRLEAVRDAIDADASAGQILLGTSGMAATLATFTCNDPSGTPSAGTFSFDGFPKEEEAAAGGTLAAAEIRDGAGTLVASGLTVGLSGSGADIIVDNTNVNSGQLVRIESVTITHG